MRNTPCRVWINGEGLQDISDSIYVLDVVEPAPEMEIKTVNRTTDHGIRMLGKYTREREVTVAFLIRSRDVNVRRQILDDVIAWCVDGELTTNDRDGQYANAVVTEYPALESNAKWSDAISATFLIADGFWHSDEAQQAAVSYAHSPEPGTIGAATPQEVTLMPIGTADECFLEFTVKNDEASATMNDIIITAGDYSFTFASLGLAHGQTLVCTYDNNGYISFTINGTSVMAKRTGDDDIILDQRAANTIAIQTIKAATFTAIARGRWR